MPDIATISTFLGSIKTATEIAKAIKGADLSLEKAEAKLKMADLISALADAKIQAAEIQDLLQEKDEKIVELEKAVEFKLKLVRKYGVYFDETALKLKGGEPYCSHCWEANHKAIHLVWKGISYPGKVYGCPSCQTQYDIRS
ncbi:MAG: hypothetical protein WA584_11295 [Pyrinomonadaceae bacterium]